jgi:hypothetical protein
VFTSEPNSFNVDSLGQIPDPLFSVDSVVIPYISSCSMPCVCWTYCPCMIPALLNYHQYPAPQTTKRGHTITSSRPHLATAPSTSALISASDETSHLIDWHSEEGYCFVIYSAAFCAAGSLISEMNNNAPSDANWRAVSNPIPLFHQLWTSLPWVGSKDLRSSTSDDANLSSALSHGWKGWAYLVCESKSSSCHFVYIRSSWVEYNMLWCWMYVE